MESCAQRSRHPKISASQRSHDFENLPAKALARLDMQEPRYGAKRSVVMEEAG